MKRTAVGVILCAWLGTAAASTQMDAQMPARIGQRVPAFSTETLDVAGASSVFDSQATQRITAYVVLGTLCPASQAYAERLRQLEETYTPRGVDFLYIYPNREDTREKKIAFHTEKQLHGRLVDDRGGTLARVLGAERTAELFVADRKGTVVYHGGIDDSRDPKTVTRRYLATALDETLAGKPVTTPESQVLA